MKTKRSDRGPKCSRKHHLDLEEQIERVVAHAQDIDEFSVLDKT